MSVRLDRSASVLVVDDEKNLEPARAKAFSLLGAPEHAAYVVIGNQA